ncbi:MAG: DUF4364 family protein [Eubacteriales bacterium]|nr:DUF4364 family protein [Eubacteriales bacterium]
MSEYPKHVLTDTETQILILKTVHNFGEISHFQLIDFMSYSGIMNYFSLCQGLVRLKNGGQIYATKFDNDEIYRTTPAGEQALSLFISHGMDSAVDKINYLTNTLKDKYKREREITHDIIHEKDREYHVVLSLNEQYMPLLKLDISLPTSELANAYAKNWPKKAQFIYETIIKTLSEEEQK